MCPIPTSSLSTHGLHFGLNRRRGGHGLSGVPLLNGVPVLSRHCDSDVKKIGSRWEGRRVDCEMRTVLKERGREGFAVLYEQRLHALPWPTCRPTIPGAQSVSFRNRHTSKPGPPEVPSLYEMISAKHTSATVGAHLFILGRNISDRPISSPGSTP